MRRTLTLSVLVLCLLFSFSNALASERPVNYRAVFKPFYGKDGRLKIAIRRFEASGGGRYLTVDATDLKAEIIDGDGPRFEEIAFERWRNTPYVNALFKYTVQNKESVQNSGMRSSEAHVKGLFLTIDMCPSKTHFDRDLFESTMRLSKGAPVPIAIAVSALWMDRHAEEFSWIREQEAAGRLDVTWVNHTYSHPYESTRWLAENFLLIPGVDFEKEVFYAEMALIENGITPSPFFRFPGLVSDESMLLKLRELGLIPIGTDAWLAKGEQPKDGSFILVHGNGNEPPGIKKLFELYEEKKGDVRLLPLREAFAR